MVLRLIKSTRNTARIVSWILRIFPSFCFGYGVINIANESLYATMVGEIKKQSAFDLEIAGGDVIMLAV